MGITNFEQLALDIKQWGKKLGLEQIGITDTNLSYLAPYLHNWLQCGLHGTMRYLERNSVERLDPQQLLPHTSCIICCRFNYPPPTTANESIAAFAKIADYHNTIKARLETLAAQITNHTKDTIIQRVFAGNAPILEKALAAKAGLGWIGKNSLVIHPQAGSYFCLGEIYLNLPLPLDKPIPDRCGTCTRCIDNCPTKAIIKPRQLNAKQCISYLTIEYRGIIPEKLRDLLGTKIFGCDQCQQVCPWNRFAMQSSNIQSNSSNSLPQTKWYNTPLHQMFLWDESEFTAKTKNTPINRLKYHCFLRNIAVALGNSPPTSENIQALEIRRNYGVDLVQEHLQWALKKLKSVKLLYS